MKYLLLIVVLFLLGDLLWFGLISLWLRCRNYCINWVGDINGNFDLGVITSTLQCQNI